MSKLYIIAGCNGAGKTTASYTVLPEILECREFVGQRIFLVGKLSFKRIA